MQKPIMSRAFWKGAVPILLLLTFVIALVILVILTGRDPVVIGVEPSVVRPGDRLVITGRHFGDTPGTLRLAGVETPPSGVIEWTDERIVLTVPQAADSGLLFVVTDGGSSAGSLLQMERSVPHSGGASYTPGAPQISVLQETEVQIGDILVIDGKNFGTQRRASRASRLRIQPSSSPRPRTSPSPTSFGVPRIRCAATGPTATAR